MSTLSRSLCWPSAVWHTSLSLKEVEWVFSLTSSCPICGVGLYNDSDQQLAWPRDLRALPGQYHCFFCPLNPLLPDQA